MLFIFDRKPPEQIPSQSTLLYLVEFVLNILIILMLARLLGSEGFGSYVFLLTIFLFLSVLNTIGLNSVLFQEISTRPHARESIYRNGLALKILGGFMAFVLGVAIAFSELAPEIARWVVILSSIMLLASTSLSSLASITMLPQQIDTDGRMIYLLRASKRMAQFLAIIVAIAVVYHGLPPISNLLPLFVPVGLKTVLIIIIAGDLLELGALIFINSKHGVSLKPRWDSNTIRYLLRQAKPFALVSVLVIILLRANILIFRIFLPTDRIGMFALPMLMAETLLIVPIIYVTLISKTFEAVNQNRQDEFRYISRLSFHLMAMIIAPIVCIVWMFSGDIMVFLGGQLYVTSAQILAVLVWNGLILSGGTLFCAFLIGSDKTDVLIRILVLGAFISLALNFIVVPTSGIIGSAWVSLITTVAILITSLFNQNSRKLSRIWLISLPTPVFGVLVVNLLARGLHLEFFPAIIFTALFFTALLVLTRYFTQEDFRQIIRLMKH